MHFSRGDQGRTRLMKLEAYGAVVMADTAGVKKPPNMSDEVTFLVQVVPLWLPIYALAVLGVAKKESKISL